MYELIVDVTNRCFLNCKLCGTDSDINGMKFIEAKYIADAIRFVQENDCRLYLGGGCFFCHPDHQEILFDMRNINARNIVIDLPVCGETLRSLHRFPMNQYHYTASVSLWGIGQTHNRLTRSQGYSYLDQFREVMNCYQGQSSFSFVITKELLRQQEEVSAFLDRLEEQDSVYFHRLMPTGRCGSENLPAVEAVAEFAAFITQRPRRPAIRFHHTIWSPHCTAYKERLFIDWNGNVYGCGWVGDNLSFTNIRDLSIAELMILKEKQFGYRCPVLCCT